MAVAFVLFTDEEAPDLAGAGFPQEMMLLRKMLIIHHFDILAKNITFWEKITPGRLGSPNTHKTCHI